MKFDFFVLSVLLLFAFYGYASGAIQQLSHWVGVTLAYLGTRPAAAALTPLAAKKLGWPPELLEAILSTVLFILFLIVGGEASQFFLMKLFHERQKGVADRIAGAALGFGKAAAVLFALLSAMLFFGKPRARAPDRFDREMDASRTVAFVRRHNLFASLPAPALKGVREMLDAGKPGAEKKGRPPASRRPSASRRTKTTPPEGGAP